MPEPPAGPTGTVVFPPFYAAALPPPPMIGQEFGGYRIIRRLGHGGMGVVYEAEEKESGRRVALKVINQQLNSPQDRARFLREGRLAASINHPHCVYVYGTEEIEGTPVISMEFVTGGTLQQQFSEEGPLPVGRAVDAMLQVIEGLEAAQAVGILHRDIKPSNCFQDATGSVKIGDFGLSLSTLPREDTNITEAGVMVGTPAFCSPEQHRGEELDARTDMYAVGVTLYYLLTGKLPFEGQTMPQLIANTLEKRAQSPRLHRKEIPDGLARVILRCLNKHPSERFKSYPDLRRALEPYASSAPTPATLGLRFVAGMLDFLVLTIFGQTAMLLFFGDPFAMMDQFSKGGGKGLLLVAPWFVLSALYFALPEWRWGATPGKAICRLRVVAADRSFPSLGQALLRVTLYLIIPVLPYWIVARGDPMSFAGSSWGVLMSFSFYGILALLFITARRRNGFAAVHDLATRTRVVSRAAVQLRPVLPTTGTLPVDVKSNPQVGPYHVLEPLGNSGGVEWVMGYDLRLLRRVLIRRVPPGTPPLPNSLRHVSRAARLRWLAGRREATGNWDAFEGVPGQPLVDLMGQPQPWAQVRFWLYDLAGELSAAEKDDSFPEVLSLDRVWITTEGRAKLLDFPAPGTTVANQAEARPTTPPQSADARAKTFLNDVARTALNGNPQHAQLSVRLALHARQFVESLPALKGAEAIASALRPLLRRTAEVTRPRRAAMVACCLVFPLFVSVAMMFGLSLMRDWRQKNPELMQLRDVMTTWKAAHTVWMPKGKHPTDEQFGIYIAANCRGVITNESVWSSTLARTFIAGEARKFAETSLVKYESPTTKQLAEAEAALRPIVKQQAAVLAPGNGDQMNVLDRPGMSTVMFWATFLIYVGLPAIVAALLFRGGLVLLATGVTYVRKDGRRASRLRLFWRSLVCWSPVVGALVLGGIAVENKSMLFIVLGA
ncbi:MAG: protein kinase, partial [Verrucomicrobia bacterium]|nr:protein kinase [Verrucomicrobiota bacterium]